MITTVQRTLSDLSGISETKTHFDLFSGVSNDIKTNINIVCNITTPKSPIHLKSVWNNFKHKHPPTLSVGGGLGAFKTGIKPNMGQWLFALPWILHEI